MARPQLVEHVGVVYRDVADDHVRLQDELEHVLVNGSRIHHSDRRTANQFALLQGWRDQRCVDLVEVNLPALGVRLLPEALNHKTVHGASPQLALSITRPVRTTPRTSWR
ncbi:hypothetical protein D9M69_622100 [compost metagenome]